MKITLMLRKIVYLSFLGIDNLFHRQNKLFVLCYHSINEDSWRFSIDPHIFKRQMIYLKKHYCPISLETLEKYLRGEIQITKPSFAITFDDGYDNLNKISDFCCKENLLPTVMILASPRDANREEMATKQMLLNKKHIKKLLKNGWAIGCHSQTHPNLKLLSQEALEKEISGAKKILEQNLGKPIRYFAYPKGNYNGDIVAKVKQAGFKLAFSMDDEKVNKKTDPFTFPRIGIDRTHSFLEFQAAFSPSVILIRKAIKKIHNKLT
jgi:peptidoglycan/xylan/chitin deacetylase (PgdA/CDA1 family)